MPESDPSPDGPALQAALARLGVATSEDLQRALARSQPTVSRLLTAAAGRVAVLGRGRRARYALPKSIHGAAARQPLQWVHGSGRIERWGTLTLLQGPRLHVEGGGGEWLTEGALPWFMAPLRFEGFLGRMLASRLAPFGFGTDPSLWTLEQQLFAALQTPDSPGALVVGDGPGLGSVAAAPVDDAGYDGLADAVVAGGHPGSSAGGEQPKFLARRPDGAAVLVKFSPPHGTPFGERWSDLLRAEALALSLLAEHGVQAAVPRVVRGARRTFLESPRFDRIGRAGRAHAVPLWAAHEAFVGGARRHWAATCEVLAQQRRLPREAADQAAALLAFGRLIGNSDMHFGNLSLSVRQEDVRRGRFALAPLYDMLPMRWRPDPNAGGFDLLPFAPEPADLQSPARPLAQAFWSALALDSACSARFRSLAREMEVQLRG